MNFDEYQKESRKTAMYPEANKNLWYPALGLSGEAGEVAEKIKKIYRDSGGEITDERRGVLEKELGDVLWYVAQIATELGLSLDKIAEANLEKLFSRLERGTIHGDGDDR